jgi:hypothetical protein
MKPFTFVFAALIAFGGLMSSARAAAVVGEPAPDFSLFDLEGHACKLSDFKGKIVVLEWNNPDCPFVHKHYDSGNIPKLQHAAMDKGVVWLMINSGAHGEQGGDYSAGEITSWLTQHNSAPTAYLRDSSGAVGRLYGAKATPHLFVIRTDGILAYNGGIDSIRSADQADIPRAVNYVAAALTAVEAGKAVKHANTQPYGCPIKY